MMSATVPARPVASLPGSAMAALNSWRDRLLADERFQRWIMRTPLLRRYARRHAASLFELCAGFVHSQILYASVRLGLLEALRRGPLSLAELQRSCALTASNLQLLLSATDALGLTQLRAGDTHGLGLLGAALLGNPAVLQMIEHQPLFYADMQDTVALLQGNASGGKLRQYWGYSANQAPASLSDGAIGGYTGLMSATQSLVSQELLSAYDFRSHRRLLDVGGGDGTFLCAVARKLPALGLMLFDLPAVTQRARTRLTAAGLSARVDVHAGDFAGGPLPIGADVITLVRVLHDHDDAAALQLLQSVRRALPRGGRVVIAEPMREVPGSLAAAQTYLGFYLLAMGQGHVRNAAELADLLHGAGFGSTRAHRTDRPWQCAVISAARS